MGDPGSSASPQELKLDRHPFFSALKQPWAIGEAQKMMVRSLKWGWIVIAQLGLVALVTEVTGMAGTGNEDPFIILSLLFVFCWPLIGFLQALKIYYLSNGRLSLPAHLAAVQPPLSLIPFLLLDEFIEYGESLFIGFLICAIIAAILLNSLPILTYRRLWAAGLAYRDAQGGWPEPSVLLAELGGPETISEREVLAPGQVPAVHTASKNLPTAPPRLASDKPLLALVAGLSASGTSWLLLLVGGYHPLDLLDNMVPRSYYGDGILYFFLLLGLNLMGGLLGWRYLRQVRTRGSQPKHRSAKIALIATLCWPFVFLGILSRSSALFFLGLMINPFLLVAALLLAKADHLFDLNFSRLDSPCQALVDSTRNEGLEKALLLQPLALFRSYNWRHHQLSHQRQLFTAYPHLRTGFRRLVAHRTGLIFSLGLGLVSWTYLFGQLFWLLENLLFDDYSPGHYWYPLLSLRVLKLLLLLAALALALLLYLSDRLAPLDEPAARNLLAWASLWLLWPLTVIELTLDPYGGNRPYRGWLLLTLGLAYVAPFVALRLARGSWRNYRRLKQEYLDLFHATLKAAPASSSADTAAVGTAAAASADVASPAAEDQAAESLQKPFPSTTPPRHPSEPHFMLPLGERPAFRLGLVAFVFLLAAYYRLGHVDWTGLVSHYW